MTDLLIGLAVLASVSALFGLGWYLGRRTEIQRQVDDAFRRETRLRHPAAGTRAWFDASPEMRAAALAKHRPAPRRAQPAPWPVQGLAMREAMAGAQALSAAVRDFGVPAPRDTRRPEKTLSDHARGPEWPT